MDEHPSGPPGGRPAGDADPGQPPKLAQFDNTLEHLARLCARLEQAEQRFKQMTDECGTVLDGLVSVDRRHATTLATLNDRLGDWCSIERKLLEESARRIERFERGVEHEWTALRRLHEEPLSELRDQADKLRMACLDAASLARQRLDTAEQTYAMQAADLERRLAEWSRQVLHAASTRAITDGSNGNGDAGTQLAAQVAIEPWPLDGVAQLHQELRTGAVATPSARPYQPERDVELSAASVSTDGVESEKEEPATLNPERPARGWRAPAFVAGAITLVVFAAVLVALYVNQMQRRLVDLEAKAQEAVRQAKTVQPPAPASDPTPAFAAEAAGRADTLVAILAAPELRRYDLAGVGDGQGAYGQVLWSRPNGMALTARRLPVVPGKVYKVWIQGDGRTAAAGVLEFQGTAAARLVVPGPLTLPRPAAITVTLESTAAVDQPSGPVYLTRVPVGPAS
ncbi:MAG: hypothetical protein ACM3NQ_14225 [Bacteroidales bacterium]